MGIEGPAGGVSGPAFPSRGDSSPTLVVAGALIRGNQMLAARRLEPPELAGGWELPGGKVEPGETTHQALHRELMEELGIEVEIGDRVGGVWPLGARHVMHVWFVTVVGDVEPRPLEQHDELRWVGPADFDDLPWLPGDLPAARAAFDAISQRPGLSR